MEQNSILPPADAGAEKEKLLEASGLVKDYEATRAVDDMSVSAQVLQSRMRAQSSFSVSS
jgi:hypothetical protein